MKIALYDATHLEEIEWPEGPEGEILRRFLCPLVRDGVGHYIDNVQTNMQILVCGDQIIPITINEAEYENSYVCSPFSYFISYARESLQLIDHPLARKGTEWGLGALGKLLRTCHFNKVVVVNNWPYSTNLHPKIDQEALSQVTSFLKERFPDYALLFRSVDEQINTALFRGLKDNNYSMIASRQIFYTQTPTTTFFNSRLFKSDLKLLEATDYEVLDDPLLTDEEQKRILDLYAGVYISKYSNLNPNINLRFIRLAMEQKGLRFKVMKKRGVIDGVVGYQCRHGILMCPFFGYDLTVPQEVGLYRNLSTLLLLQAKKEQSLFHQSSGASTYKKMRKAESCIEYMAVYHDHLSLKRKAPWIILKSILNTIGIKFMMKY